MPITCPTRTPICCDRGEALAETCDRVGPGRIKLPLEVPAAGDFLAGKRLDAESIAAAAELAAKPAKPLDNTDLTHFWRKKMVRVVVEQALSAAARQT